MSASCRRGGKRIGPQVCIQLCDSNLTTKERKRNSFSITLVFLRAQPSTSRQDGGPTTGSRCRSIWDESGAAHGRSSQGPRKSILYLSGKGLFASPIGGFDPVYPTCYKRLFCAGRAGPGSYFSCPLFRVNPGAKSDAAKLNTPSGLAVEACSEFRNNIEARMGLRMLGPRSRDSRRRPEGSA